MARLPNMSLGDRTVELRALAHPLRLRMLSLLTGGAMTAAEIARELTITHANASYHLRQLLSVDLIEIVGEEQIRGGIAKRYRYNVARTQGQPPGSPGDAGTDPVSHVAADELQLVCAAVAVELQRRAAHRQPGPTLLTDAELWVEPGEWEDIRDQVRAVSDRLHTAARPPHTTGTVRVNATMVLFSMDPGR
jgi:DNA-binding transcriptional ArsR family regulator